MASLCGDEIQNCERSRNRTTQASRKYPNALKPWWFQSDEGRVCVSVKYGSWTLELAKGKPSVEVASGEELIKALESIKTAVEAGELDQQIESASAGLRSGFGR